MKITCIKDHYSPVRHAGLYRGEEYDYLGMKIEHGVVYVSIRNFDRNLDIPAKYFFTKDLIREILLDKLLDLE